MSTLREIVTLQMNFCDTNDVTLSYRNVFEYPMRDGSIETGDNVHNSKHWLTKSLIYYFYLLFYLNFIDLGTLY